MASELVSKVGTKSVVWDYFGLEKHSDGQVVDEGEVVCRTCRRKVLARHGNTSNLLSHLRANHGRIFSEVREAMKTKEKTSRQSGSTSIPIGQSSLKEVVEKSQKYEKKGKKWKELTDAVTYCLAKDNLPVYCVEKPGFQSMVKAFDGRYDLPSRSYFSRTALPSLYTSTRERVKQEIATMKFFSSTTDLWSSIGMRPYMSYTIHFIDKEWKLNSRCLQTHFIPEDHTGENLAEAMEATLDAWDLDVTNQVCLTTDSGANIIKAAADLGWPRLSCFGHNLHLAITKALANDHRCTRALGLCRKIVSAFSMSWKRKRELIKAQVNLQLPQHSLVADCPTRWGSMAKMVSRILEQEQGIRVVLSTDRKTTHLIPTWQDIDVIQSINQALSPLSSLTDMLSGESYVTVSAVLPIVHLMENNLLKEEESDTQLTKDIKCRIKGDLSSRYEDLAEVTEILQIATFVDPRFKTKYLNETETADVQDKVITECSHLEIESTTLSTADAPPPAKKKNLGTFFKDHEKTEEEDQMPVLSKEQQISSELLVYVSATKLDFEEDPLLWWKLESRKYPLLSILARKYLCVCATSSASERLFSSSGNIVSSSRASMKPEKVDMLTFLSKNL